MEWCEVIPEWLSALGTVGAVIVALFQKTISDWYNKPKISITCPDNNRCRVESSANTDNQSKGRELKVRLKITIEERVVQTMRTCM